MKTQIYAENTFLEPRESEFWLFVWRIYRGERRRSFEVIRGKSRQAALKKMRAFFRNPNVHLIADTDPLRPVFRKLNREKGNG